MDLFDQGFQLLQLHLYYQGSPEGRQLRTSQRDPWSQLDPFDHECP